MLTSEQKQAFDQIGFVRQPGAFSKEDAAEMVDRIWAAMKDKFDVTREDPASWTIQMGYGFADQKKDPAFHKVGSPTTIGAIDSLLGRDQWVRPSNWGQLLVTFPEAEKTWTVPTEIWHTDFGFLPSTNPFGVMVFAFLSDVGPKAGGTVVIERSHRLVQQFVARQPREFLEKMKRVRLAFMDSETWLRDLATSDDCAKRIERFTKTEIVAGIPVRVVELTGSPGDIVLCQPWLLHAVAPNCGRLPRMMCVQRIHAKEPVKLGA